MEKKLPDDHLEKYIRDSFENYEDRPSDQVWDRIDRSLTEAYKPTGGTRFRWLVPTLITLAAASILGLIVMNASLRKQLDSIKSDHEQLFSSQANPNKASENQDKASSLSDQNNSNQFNDHSEINNSVPQSDPNKKTNSEDDKIITNSSTKKAEVAIARNSNETANEKLIPTSGKSDQSLKSGDSENMADHPQKSEQITKYNSKEKNDQKNHQEQIKSKKMLADAGTRVFRSNHPASAILPEDSNKNLTKKADKKISSTAHAHHADIEKLASSLTKNENIQSVNQELKEEVAEKVEKAPKSESVIQSRPRLEVFALHRENELFPERSILLHHSLPDLAMDDLVSIESTDRVYLQAGILSESGTISERNKYFPTTDLKNDFASNKSWQAGIGIDKSLAKNLFFTTGFIFKHLDVNTHFNAVTTFDQRLEPKVGRPPFEHHFGQQVRTPTGSTYLEITTEQSNPNAVINNTDPVKFDFLVHSQVNYISIPIGLKYLTSSGNFVFGAGAGIHLNTFLSNQVNIDKVQVQSGQLAHPGNKDHSENQRGNLFYINSAFTGSLGYKLNDKFTVMLTPEYYLPISQRNRDRDAKIKSTSYGIQLGFSYAL